MVTFPLSWDQFLIIVGEVTLVAILGILLLAFFFVAVALYSINTGKFIFPRLLSSGFFMLEGLIKAICGLFGLDNQDIVTFFIRIHNMMNIRHFEEIPVERRVLFLPQCLRSSRCPADLTPEGLKCKNCGQCTVGGSVERLEKIGYRVFIVPGSSFIQRMVKKYRPAGIIGVGCITEVKEGLEMCDRMGVCGMGVVTLKDGCVETLVNWLDVFEVACLGMDGTLIPKDLDVSPH